MKILLTADPFLPVPPPLYGGIERIVHGLGQELRSRGHQVGLVAHAESTSPVDYFRPWPDGNGNGGREALRQGRALLGAARDFGPDVIHSFSRLLLLLPLLFRRGAKLMSYQRYTGGWRNRVAASLGDRSFAFTGCSDYIARQGRPFGGRWEAIPNFVDVDFYRCTERVDEDAPLVFLSRIEAIKGAHAAIEMARRAGRRLILAGNRVESEEGRQYWKSRIEPHLGEPGIEYVGPVNDEQKNELLGRAAAMIVPIEWDEPFGIVFAESLACGTPVISSPRGALPEIVENGRHGFLVNSVDDGVAAIGKLAQIDRRACRMRAESHFSQSVVCDAYLDLYQSLLAGTR
jgi:glycosyltransferase involved in cell wall biosynthesis